MRCLMLTIAVVLGLAVVEVTAQGHGAPAAPAAKAHEPPATNAHEAPAAKEHATPAAKDPATSPAKAGTVTPAPTPPDLATVMERINKQVGTVVTEIRTSKPAVHAGPAAHPRKSPVPQVASHARVAAPTHSRVELDWRTPLLVWPEELLQATLESPPNSR